MNRIILICLVFSSLAGHAQNTDSYSVKNYTDANGLPQNSVKSIAVGDGGFIWLATEAGLTRFDGSSFFVYDKAYTNARSNRIKNIQRQLSTGDLYGCSEYHELIPIQDGHVISKPILYHKIFPIPQSFSKIAKELPDPDSIYHFENFIIQTTAEKYYSVTKDNLIFNYNKQTLAIPFKHNSRGVFFVSNKVLFYMDEKGSFTMFNDGRRKQVQLTGNIVKEKNLQNKQLRIYWNSNTDQVFICLNKCLYLVQVRKDSLETKLILNDFDFNGKQIITTYYDVINKRLFLGSMTQGLFVLQYHLFSADRLLMYPNNSVTYALSPYSDNTVLFANGDLVSTNDKELQLPLIKENSNGFSLVIDQDKNIWTQKDSVIYKFSPKGDKLLQSYNFPQNLASLYLDKHNILWIGTADGIYSKNLSGPNLPPAIVTHVKDANCLYLKDEVMWIGTPNGLYCYNSITKRLSLIPRLATVHVRSIYTRNKEMWIGTYGDGFYLYKDNILTKMPLDEQKYLNNAHCFLEDSKGFFWISTNKGLFRVAINDLLAYSEHKTSEVFYLYYDKDSGFNTNEFNGGCQPCGAILKNGFFTFPSLVGSVMFNPILIHPELPDKAIYIDRILKDDKEAGIKDTIKTTQDFSRLQIFISSPYFGHPNNLSFEYKFANDTQWTKVNTNQIIIFTTLPYGTHNLLIRKSNGFGYTNFAYHNMVIIVSPYYYQTWWFYGCAALFITVGLIFIYKARIRIIVKRNEILEKLITERTIDLERSITDLQESQQLLKQQTTFQKRLLAAITHDIKSPLRYLVLTGKRLYQTDEVIDSVKEGIRAIYLSASSMYNFTDNLLNYSKLFLNENEIRNDHINLKLLITDKINIFSEIITYNHIAIQNNIRADIYIDADKTIISVILHNLIDNALKYCSNGTVTFDVLKKDKSVILILQDTGRGMSEDILKWLNGKSDLINTDGLGLKMVLELAAKTGLKIQAESAPDEGTIIKLTLINSH
ncbi:MAG: ATP-binding protein [Bacteroidota bacterium]